MVLDEETVDQINESAVRGAAFLDQRRPGWAEEIDTKKLAMILPCRCILGQLGGEYETGFHEIVDDGHPAYGERAKELGFVSPCEFERPVEGDDDAEYDALDEAWKAEIAKRL